MNTPRLLILSGIAMAAASCTTITGETKSYALFEEGTPGGEVIETSTVKATVTGIDATKRKLTLVTPSSEKFTVTAGPEVVNFDQIKIGDQLNATLTEEIIIRMAKPGEKTDDKANAVIGLAPVGAKPGVLMKETVQVTATVTAIDLKKRKATLQFADGTTRKVTVRKDVDLTQRKIGEKVVIRSTEIFAVKIEDS